ncbi:MAG TPA: hypothetical protein ENN43_02535 [bacterium]|nr:hypothetical protein [bacterium]
MAKKKKSSAPAENNNTALRGAFIAAIAILAAVVLGVTSSYLRSRTLEQSPPVISSINPSQITIKHPETGEEQIIPISPASAGVVESKPVTEKGKSLDFFLRNITSKESIHRLELEEAKLLFDSGKAVFIDTRSRGEYDAAHIKGAIHIQTNAGQEVIEKTARDYRNKILIPYCHGIGCRLSDRVAYRLFDAGHRKIGIFFGGWQKWDEHGYPEDKN